MTDPCCAGGRPVNPYDFRPIYAALFALLDGAVADGVSLPNGEVLRRWRSSSRHLLHWADVPSEQQPAMFQTQIDEEPDKRIGQLPIWTLNVKIYLYVTAPDNRVSTSIYLNPLLGVIRAALKAVEANVLITDSETAMALTKD